MAANSAYHYTFHGGSSWAKTIVDGATELANYMEKCKLIIPDDG